MIRANIYISKETQKSYLIQKQKNKKREGVLNSFHLLFY